MQAFRVAATIDDDRRLRLTDVPFQPGTAVDVIVLTQETTASFAAPIQARGDKPSQREERLQLAGKQYRLAEQYPNEYVILVGEQVVYHTADKEQAVEAFQRVGVDHPLKRPVIVRPGSRLRKPPMVRGRALTRKLRFIRCPETKISRSSSI